MIDELSLGWAPTIVEQLLEIVRAIQISTTIILVEQSVNVACVSPSGPSSWRRARSASSAPPASCSLARLFGRSSSKGRSPG